MQALLQMLPVALLLLALVRRRYPGELLIERARRRLCAPPRAARPVLRGVPADALARATCVLAWDLGARAPPVGAAPQ